MFFITQCVQESCDYFLTEKNILLLEEICKLYCMYRASGKVWEKFEKSAILAQKCKIMDFAQIVHNNAILLNSAIWCDFCSIVRDCTLTLFQMPCR